MNKRQLLNQRGFTLIELMIVVGIIGILVAIAAPNFARYQSKARQSEAKIALSAIYAAEKSFYSEYTAYHTNLNAIGYEPEGLKRYYKVGFQTMNTGNVAGYTPNATASSVAGVSGDGANFARSEIPTTWLCPDGDLSGNLGVAPIGQPGGAGASGDNPQTFIAGASGAVRQGKDCDHWRINSDKLLANTVVNL